MLEYVDGLVQCCLYVIKEMIKRQ